MTEQPELRADARLPAILAVLLVAAACIGFAVGAFDAVSTPNPMPTHRVSSPSTDVAEDTARAAATRRIAVESGDADPSGASPIDDATLPTEYLGVTRLGELSPDQLTHARGILSNLHKMRCTAMAQMPDNDHGHLDGDVARARLLRKVEVSLAAIDALERGLYIVIPRDAPPPPLIPHTDRLMFGSGGLNKGQRGNIVLLMPHSRYPGLGAVGEYETDLAREQRRDRIRTFNLKPLAERRELRAQFLRLEELSDQERTRLLDIMPIGTEWNETAGMLLEPPASVR